MTTMCNMSRQQLDTSNARLQTRLALSRRNIIFEHTLYFSYIIAYKSLFAAYVD